MHYLIVFGALIIQFRFLKVYKGVGSIIARTDAAMESVQFFFIFLLILIVVFSNLNRFLGVKVDATATKYPSLDFY